MVSPRLIQAANNFSLASSRLLKNVCKAAGTHSYQSSSETGAPCRGQTVGDSVIWSFPATT